MIELVRYAYTEQGVFGRIGKYHTLERPWKNNQRDVSCIPKGVYQVLPRKYNKGGYDALQVMNVTDRGNILFHVGNTFLDSEGCVLIGEDEGFINNKWAITNSRKAFKQFMESFGNGFILHIKGFEENFTG